MTKTIEGLEGTFTTKIAMKRAWEQKIKNEIQAEKDAIAAAELEKLDDDFQELFAADDKPRKELPEEVWNIINAAREQLHRDEFECLVDPSTITTSTFCCLDHFDECVQRRENLEDMNRLLLEADLQVAADRVDYHNTTFVCRYQLQLIIQQFFKKYRLPLDPQRQETLLDGCVMNHGDQVRLREWANPEKRSNPLFDIPLSGYSTTRFALIVSSEINAMQQKKIFVMDD
mgnify:CR=1 FL=1